MKTTNSRLSSPYHPIFNHLISWILVFQITLSSCTSLWATDGQGGEPVEITEASVRSEADQMAGVLSGKNTETHLRPDVFGLLDLIPLGDGSLQFVHQSGLAASLMDELQAVDTLPRDAHQTSVEGKTWYGYNPVTNGNFITPIAGSSSTNEKPSARQQFESSFRAISTIYNVHDNLSASQGKASHSEKDQPRIFAVFYEGRPIFHSRFKVQAIAFYGDYLVFIEPHTYFPGLPANEKAEASPDPNAAGVQYVSFIDLKTYASTMGKSTPPLSTIPVAVGGPVTSLKSGPNGKLSLVSENSAASVPSTVFATYSEIHQTTLDVIAALVDPKTYENAGPAVEEATRYFLQAADQAALDGPAQAERAREFSRLMNESLRTHQRQIADARKNAALDGNSEDASQDPKKEAALAAERLDQYQKALLESIPHAESIKALQKTIATQRRFLARLQLIWHRISAPRPAEAPETVRQALAMVAFGLQAKGDARTRALREGGLGLITLPSVKFGVGVAAAASLAVLYPEQFTHFIYQALDIGGVVLGGLLGRLRGSGILLGRATLTTFSGLKPAVFYQAYLTEGRLPHFLVGITGLLGTAVAILATPILMVNSWLLARDLSLRELPKYTDFTKEGQTLFDAGIGYLKTRVDAFIARQRAQQVEYMRLQTATYARMAAKHKQDTNVQYTEADNAEVDRILNELEAQHQSWVSRGLKKVVNWQILRRKAAVSAGEAQANAEIDPLASQANAIVSEEILAERQIQTFRDALMNFLFSYSSLTGAFGKLSNAWNGFTIFRRIVWSPTLWFIQLCYPNFINSALGDGSQDRLIIPSEANGGLMNPLESGYRVLQVLTFDKDLEALRAWERQIIPIEQEVTKTAVKVGYQALSRYIQAEGSDLKDLIRTGGIQSLTDPRLNSLSLKYRTFFRHFVDQLTARTLRRILTEVARSSAEQPLADEANVNIRELKARTINSIGEIRAKMDDTVRLTTEVAGSEGVYEVAAGIADSIANRSLSEAGQATLTTLRHRALAIIDPKTDPTMGRVQSVLRMMRKPDSIPRAVRASLSSLLMAKTVGLSMTLFTLAGVESGVLKPLHDVMFGPDSYFYLGRMPFVNGLLSGLFLGIFSNVWMKLQADEKHSEDFGEVPDAAEAKRGFMHWYYKQTFQNPKNTWWINQKIWFKIIWGNMRPAFVTIALTNFLSLGRFDLDGYLIGYVTTYLSPLLGFNPKLEQGLEFASYFPLAHFPQNLRGHPKVQSYLQRKQQAIRFYFAIYEKTFVDLQETIIGLFNRMSGPFGETEAASRLLLSGYTPTELAYKALTWTQQTLGFVPGLSPAIDFCTRLLTHNYTAASPDRIPPSKTK